MSNYLEGDDEAVFAVLRAAFRAAAGQGDTVLVASVSGACYRGGQPGAEAFADRANRGPVRSVLD